MRLKQFVLAVLGVFGLAVDTPAQKLKVTPEGLTAGGNATISVSNPGRAGRNVLVEIDNGGVTHPEFDYVTVTLDDNGNGSANWHVPSGWNQANFNAPETPVISILVREKRDPEEIELEEELREGEDDAARREDLA